MPAHAVEPANQEFEVTPEMVAAGLTVLSNFDPEMDNGSEFVRQVYLAMCASRGGSAANGVGRERD